MAPKHQPQLSGAATQAYDCGTRSLSMVIDWATRGKVRPSVKSLRRRMGLPPTKPQSTNPLQWDAAVQSFDTPGELKGAYEMLAGSPVTAGDWDDIVSHLEDDKMVIVAVDYGVLRRLAPRKVGSKTFSGFHAIPLKKIYDNDSTMDYDPLFDGRAPGIPSGPVRMPLEKLRKAAVAVGQKLAGREVVYGYLMERAIRIGGGVDLPEPEEPVSLSSIHADLLEALDASSKAEMLDAIRESAADLAAIIGPYEGQAEPDDEPKTGVTT